MDPRNVSRRLAVVLAALPSLAGVLVVPDGDDQAPGESVTQWVRLQVDDIDSEPAGWLQGARAEVRRSLVTADIFVRGAPLQTPGTMASVDDVDGLAYTVRVALSGSVEILDYVADPTGATTTGRLLQFTSPALTRRLDPIDGVQHRQVLATATLLAQV